MIRTTYQPCSTGIATTHSSTAQHRTACYDTAWQKAWARNAPDVHEALVLVALDGAYKSRVLPVGIGTIVNRCGGNLRHPCLIRRMVLAEGKSAQHFRRRVGRPSASQMRVHMGVRRQRRRGAKQIGSQADGSELSAAQQQQPHLLPPPTFIIQPGDPAGGGDPSF